MRTAERPRFSPESKRVVVPKAFGTPQNDRFRSGQGESHPGRIFSCSKGPDTTPRRQERRIDGQGPHRIATTRIDSGLSSAKLFSRMSRSSEPGRASRAVLTALQNMAAVSPIPTTVGRDLSGPDSMGL